MSRDVRHLVTVRRVAVALMVALLVLVMAVTPLSAVVQPGRSPCVSTWTATGS